MSVGVANVSTSPVVIVTLRIQSLSRCRGCGLTVHADVGNAATWPHQIGCELKCRRHANRCDDYICAETIRHASHPR